MPTVKSAGVCAAPEGGREVDKQYGESIYGTRAGRGAGPWRNHATRLDGLRARARLEWTVLALPSLPQPIRSARLLRDGSSVEFSVAKETCAESAELRPDEADR